MSIQLDIYIEPDCLTCDYAYEVAEHVRSELPEVNVTMIDLSDPETSAPPSVFAVPTYVLNGERLSLGNPDKEELIQDLQELVHAY